MSRCLDLVGRYISAIGAAQTNLISLRVSSLPVGTTYRSVAELDFTTSPNDKVIATILQTTGFYSDDTVYWTSSSGEKGQCIPSEFSLVIAQMAVTHLRIEFFREPMIVPSRLSEILRQKTAFGLMKTLADLFSVTRVPIYFGASTVSLPLTVECNQKLQSFSGLPFVTRKTENFNVVFRFINATGLLTTIAVSAFYYLDAARKQLAQRYSFKPKEGLLIESTFPHQWFESEFPLSTWTDLLTEVGRSFDAQLKRHTQAQVKRLEARIKRATKRHIISYRGHEIGFRPANETETIVIFERMLALDSGKRLSCGASVRMLDYSSQDIDSICEYSPRESVPATFCPLEFEYELSNFFAHGHDDHQVRLIVCYSIGQLNFPLEMFGEKFDLQGSGLRRLSNRTDGTALDCIVLEDMVTLK
jgi:hypothetical protein